MKTKSLLGIQQTELPISALLNSEFLEHNISFRRKARLKNLGRFCWLKKIKNKLIFHQLVRMVGCSATPRRRAGGTIYIPVSGDSGGGGGGEDGGGALLLPGGRQEEL
jgi:hypothetical protein